MLFAIRILIHKKKIIISLYQQFNILIVILYN